MTHFLNLLRRVQDKEPKLGQIVILTENDALFEFSPTGPGYEILGSAKLDLSLIQARAKLGISLNQA